MTDDTGAVSDESQHWELYKRERNIWMDKAIREEAKLQAAQARITLLERQKLEFESTSAERIKEIEGRLEIFKLTTLKYGLALEKIIKEDNGGEFSWQEIARKALAGE